MGIHSDGEGKKRLAKKRIRVKLQEVLTENGMSQNELAKRLGIGAATVNDLCKKDIKRVNVETLAKVAEMFDIEDITELLTLENKEGEAD
jgi:transcriptional regulator with XRE-family HTH domain